MGVHTCLQRPGDGPSQLGAPGYGPGDSVHLPRWQGLPGQPSLLWALCLWLVTITVLLGEGPSIPASLPTPGLRCL